MTSRLNDNESNCGEQIKVEIGQTKPRSSEHTVENVTQSWGWLWAGQGLAAELAAAAFCEE